MAEGAIAGPGDRASPKPRRRAGPTPSGGVGALLRLPREVLWQRLGYRLRAPWFASAVYRLTLPTRPDGSVALGFPDPWPGNAALGGALIQGTFALADETIQNPAPLWAPIGADPAWLAELHGFAWLRDLRAVGGDGGRRAARDLVGSWIDDNARWRPLPWRPDLIGQRLAAWIAQYDFFGASADAGLRGRLLVSAARQACHLARVLPAGLTGGDLIVAIKGLIYAGLALPRGEAWLARGLALLETELARQIRADGGHVERSPSAHLAVLRHLIDLRAALDAAGRPLPNGLPAAIDGLAAGLRLFQHGDGGLALFNDSNEEESWQIDMALGRADLPSPKRSSGFAQAGAHARLQPGAPQGGFQRLVANRAVVLVDGGAPAPPGFDSHAHAGTLSFEMSVGRERLIVNCGARASGAEWRLAQRSTAAHSTLVV
ncbi:MAG TPA: heparinase II/III family protein, partial [Dongiaceae bacterium]|nr:heparinase II/III family protein [Dongiaceae bacterium]